MNDNKITPGQISCIQTMVRKLLLLPRLKNMTVSFSSIHSTSLRDLKVPEATAFIRYLKSQDPEEQKAEVMRRKIIAMAHEMKWELPGTTKVDMARLDRWMEKSSYLKKKLNRYFYAELPKLVTQFEEVSKSFLKGI